MINIVGHTIYEVTNIYNIRDNIVGAHYILTHELLFFKKKDEKEEEEIPTLPPM